MMDNEGWDGDDHPEGCTCGGKPPFCVGYTVNPQGITAAILASVVDEGNGHATMTITSMDFFVEEADEIKDHVNAISNWLNLKVKEHEAALIAQIDQAEAAIREHGR